jgi:transposase
MVLHAMDCNDAGPTRWCAPPWNRDTAAWLAIDQTLAPDHPARLVDRLVAGFDLTNLYKSYAGRGSPAHPPELLLRLALFESLQGELSPAQWYRDCRHLDPVKWLLLGLQPSLSGLYAFRDRCARLLDDLNRQVLQIARAEGHLIGDDVAFDGTFAAALGSRHRLVNEKNVDKRLEQLDAQSATDFTLAKDEDTLERQQSVPALSHAEVALLPSPPSLAPTDKSEARAPGESAMAVANATGTSCTDPSPPAPAEICPESLKEKTTSWMCKTPARRFKQRLSYRAVQEIMKRKRRCHQQTLTRRAKTKRRSAERIVICPTEPEAALGRDKLKTFRPLYNVQLARAVDAPFIVGYDVVPEVTDAGQFGPLAYRVESLCGHRPKRVVVDDKYAGHVDLALAFELGIVVYAPTSAMKQADVSRKKSEKGMIPKQDFVWLRDKQTYRCPQGHLLRFVRSGTDRRQGGETLKLMQYRCPSEHCENCPLRAKCTRTPELGRIVKRSEHDDLADELRVRMQHPDAQEFYRQRKQTVELSIADLKEHRGLRRFHGFGLGRARAQAAMLILAVNGRSLMKARDRVGSGLAVCDEAAA